MHARGAIREYLVVVVAPPLCTAVTRGCASHLCACVVNAVYTSIISLQQFFLLLSLFFLFFLSPRKMALGVAVRKVDEDGGG